ncbi:MAG: hypothetical protein K2X32_07285, partial [Phycisphaerales bacterium]|nr:hypothetical protein [Phycisphaerales bacterium]
MASLTRAATLLPGVERMTSTAAATSSTAHTNGHAKSLLARAGALLSPSDTFAHRHIAPSESDIHEMLELLGYASLDEFTAAVVPAAIRSNAELKIDTGSNSPDPRGEHELLQQLQTTARKNHVFRSMIGCGYHDTIVPPVILRNILENPGWYTQYTPYQAEIAQGRLEALLNFQTMVSDLTGLPLAGASLLDEGTAAAEAMAMCFSIAGGHDDANQRRTFLIGQDCHPQTIAVVQTRAETMGVAVLVVDLKKIDWASLGAKTCGVLAQYPTTDGRVECYDAIAQATHDAGAQFVVAADLLSLTLLKAPGEFGGGGADIVVGSAQRFGVPMGFGGPHAAFIATKTEHARRMPGRLIGVSRDAQGKPALRMAIQTREQHIKRDKATSNICTAQALLAIMASMYAVYHGPEGLRRIAQRVHAFTQTLRVGLRKLGHAIDDHDLVFDTLRVKPAGKSASDIMKAARDRKINLRDLGHGVLGITCDETTSRADIQNVLAAFGASTSEDIDALSKAATLTIPAAFARQSGYLTHPVFNSYHAEHEMLRYLAKLQSRDLSLAHSMIPLGSCTMKLNATSEMLPVTWPEFGGLHPFAPSDQWRGYAEMFTQLETWLAEITGFAGVSLQPNAGSQGEYAGLVVIRAYHHHRGE